MGKYYTIRPLPKGYCQEYWQEKKVDPDGIVRNKFKERLLAKDDYSEELAFIRKLKPGTIFDIGCGIGHFLSYVPKSWYRIGLEDSYKAALAASKYCSETWFGELRYVKIKKWIDVVTMLHVVEHLRNPEEYIDKANNMLRVGGWLIITTPNFGGPVAEMFGKNFRLLHDPTHISLFTDRSLCSMLEDYGFAVERVRHPFFKTRHFTKENLLRLFDTSKVSPPFYGNVVTVYARKK